VQGAGGGHHHHRKSVSDQVSQMGSAIDKAVQAGTLTSDQAASMKKELADVTQTLSQNASSSSTATSTSATTGTDSTTGSSSTSSQSNSLSQLSDTDRKKVLGELQDVRKQLHSAFGAQSANASGSTSSSSSASDAISQLFSQMDSNGNGSIDQNEFSQFLAQNSPNAYGYNPQGNASSAASVLTGSNFSVTA